MGINAVATGYDRKAAQIDAFINMDDKSVREIAWLKAQQDVDLNKHRKVQTALDLSLPLAGGLSAAAVASKGKRMAEFVGGTASWALFLAGMGAVFGITQAIRNRSEKADNFADKHPLFAFLTTATAAYFAGKGAILGGALGLEKLKTTGIYKSAVNTVKSGMKKFNKLEVVKKSTKFVADMVKKVPSPLKQVGKFAAWMAPLAVVLGSLSHSVRVKNAVARDYNNTYSTIKDKQLDLAQERNRMLSFENDFHKTEVY